ncbi:MAG TPA: hypothetical protein GX392_06930 [Clostridiales bacterium]|nr:hypothetical protein [Clostridiales bacterium]
MTRRGVIDIGKNSVMKWHIQCILKYDYSDCFGCLIGTGGTVTSLAVIDLELELYEQNKIHGYKLSQRRVLSIFNRLKVMSLDERKNVKGLQPERADIILPGIYILIVAMDIIGASEIVVSDKDILEGLLLAR